ncbi:phage tail tape measure protein [Parageobacillus thermoglucosidasius]|uniref:phage tail protein n=1 Tax=Parageobacillus thermoglucosidasius TaxID=1426 RepID=UPI003B6739A6
MAESVRGINVVIGADTTKLGKALSDVESKSKSIQSELTAVNRLLKFDPANTTLLAQKQQLLAQQIENTSEKLNRLKSVQQQVADQFARGEISEGQYRAFQREIAKTQQELQRLQDSLRETEQEQQKIANSTKQLQTLFEATGTSVDQFADALGSKLVNAIKNGTASSKQLDEAIKKIGQAALGTNVDLDKMRAALASVDDGNSIKNVRKELEQLSKEAKAAEKSVGDLGVELENVAGAIVAGGGIAGAIEKALDTSSLNTKIDIAFEVPEESKQAVKDAIRTIEAYGIDAEAALEGVRRQWALNKNASDEANTAIVKGAAAIARTYAGIDFTELIQETHEVASELNISNEEALGLINSLLKIGFPPEQLDIIAEYGQQLRRAGYEAEDIQAIMAAGVETGTWNIDNLLDGLKEGRIRLAEFGQEVPKATKELLENTNISAKQLQEWGKAVAKGGEEGHTAMQQVVQALANVKDETTKNMLGTQIFGTMWEDQGENIIETLMNIDENLMTTEENQQNLNDTIERLNADPAVKMQQAFQDLKTASEPLLGVIADVVSKIAEWVSENPTLAATITAVASAIGIIMGAMMALSPIITAIAMAAGAMGVSIGAIAGPIAIAIAAIAGLVAAGVAIYKNWDTIKAKAIEIWGAIKDWFSQTLESIKQFFNNAWNNIKSFTSSTWDSIKQTTVNVWNAIKTGVMAIITPFINGIKNLFNGMKDGLQTILNGLKQYFSGVWQAIKNIFLGAVLLIVDLVTGDFKNLLNDARAIFNNLKNALSSIWNGIKQVFSGAVSAIKGFVSAAWGNIKSTTSSVFNTVKSLASSVWNGIKSAISTAVNTAKSAVSSAFSAMRSAVSSIMSGIKSTITSMWNSAVSFLKGINLYSVGRNIIQGLARGISSMASAVVEKVRDIANSVTKTIRNVLDIHSPSRVMTEIGKYVVQGLVVGIESESGNLRKAAEKMSDALVPNFRKPIQISQWQQSEMTKIAKLGANERLKAVEDWLSKQYELENIVAKDEVAIWQYVLKTFKLNAEERKKVSIKLRDAKRKVDQEIFENEKKYIEERKKYNQLSLVEELKMWEEVASRWAEGSQKRAEAEEHVYQLKKQIYDELTNLNNEYANKVKEVNERLYQDELKAREEYEAKVKEINDRLAEEERKLTEEYQKAVEDRTKSLYSFAGLFDEIKRKDDVTGQGLLKNLSDQVSAFKDWQANIASLAARGIDEGLLQELRDMGPKAVDEIAALNSLSDEELNQYVQLWREKNALAKAQAVSELEGMRLETQAKIQQLRATANAELEQVRIEYINKIAQLRAQAAAELEQHKNEWMVKIKEITEGTKSELNLMSASMADIGKNSMQGLIDGLNSMMGPLRKKAQEIADTVRATIQSALDIHSPSRVMMELGKWIPAGLAEGINRNINAVVSATNRMAQATIPSVAGYSGAVVPATATINVPKMAGAKIEQHLHFYSSAPTPSETARKHLQVSRQLAMEWGL